MSTTSTIITIIICIVLVATIGYALVKGIWSAAKKITIPIQIALFIVMLVCIARLFCTKENAQKLYNGIEHTGISQNVENTMRLALDLKPGEASKPDVIPAQTATAPTESEPIVISTAVKSDEKVVNSTPETEIVQQSSPVKADAKTEEAPAIVNVEFNVTPASQPATTPAPAPAKVPDYSHLNKGKRTFLYALPVNAKVTVGFKDNTYRVIVESLGCLDASNKKEVGKLIITSLGKYVGKTIAQPDKSKITIESRYDEADDHTRVFAIIPPDAIE